MLDVREAFIRKNVKDLDFFQTVVKVDRIFGQNLCVYQNLPLSVIYEYQCGGGIQISISRKFPEILQ